MTGRYDGTFTEGSRFYGLAVAWVKEDAGESEQISLFKRDVNLATGVVSGELGSVADDPRITAVIQRGACTGPWMPLEGALAHALDAQLLAVIEGGLLKARCVPRMMRS